MSFGVLGYLFGLGLISFRAYGFTILEPFVDGVWVVWSLPVGAVLGLL